MLLSTFEVTRRAVRQEARVRWTPEVSSENFVTVDRKTCCGFFDRDQGSILFDRARCQSNLTVKKLPNANS